MYMNNNNNNNNNNSNDVTNLRKLFRMFCRIAFVHPLPRSFSLTLCVFGFCGLRFPSD